MMIREKDFKIEKDGSCFTLYLLKTKKELKDDEKVSIEAVDSFKIKGYYTTLFTAIRAAFRWRTEEKYPFKELPFREDYICYRKAIEKFNHQSRLIYESIIDLKLKTYAEHKQFLNRLQE